MKNFYSHIITNNYINFYYNKVIKDIINLKKEKICINNIISFNSYVNLINYTQDKNSILITYYIIYKILYSTMPNNITYTLKSKKIKHTELLLPENFLDILLHTKNINLKFDLINTNLITFNKENITLCTNLLISLNIPKIHSLAYAIKLSDYEEYIYTSYEYGKDFTQKTFYIDTNYSNIQFFNKDFIICIVKNKEEIFLRKIFLKNDDFEDIYHNNSLKNFHILDNNNILLLCYENKDTLLLKFNLETLSVNLFFKFNDEELSLIKCYKNFIVLMKKVNDTCSLILLNKENFSHFKTTGKFAYMDIINLHTEELVILLLENNSIKFFNLNSKEISYLNNNLIDGTILNCKFITSEKILLHERKSNKEYLSIINLSNSFKKTLLETHFSIGDICANVKENIIYLSLKENNIFNIYCIDETEHLKKIINIDALNIRLSCKV